MAWPVAPIHRVPAWLGPALAACGLIELLLCASDLASRPHGPAKPCQARRSGAGRGWRSPARTPPGPISDRSRSSAHGGAGRGVLAGHNGNMTSVGGSPRATRHAPARQPKQAQPRHSLTTRRTLARPGRAQVRPSQSGPARPSRAGHDEHDAAEEEKKDHKIGAWPCRVPGRVAVVGPRVLRATQTRTARTRGK